jgi:hypothetical protein
MLWSKFAEEPWLVFNILAIIIIAGVPAVIGF